MLSHGNGDGGHIINVNTHRSRGCREYYSRHRSKCIEKEIELLKAKNNIQDEKIRELKTKQKNINDRLRAQERYTRKDSLLIVNPPFDVRQVFNVMHETLKFFEKFLGVEITEDSIKACHIIPNSGNEFQLPKVICIFIFFADKQSVYEKRKRLRKTKNRINKSSSI